MNDIHEIHHAMLTLPDGTQLAYRAWMPKDAEQNPVPAILEFLPYRKNDGTIVRDEITMPQTAKHGYACIRVDIRGCGESQGLFDDEYSAQELQDGQDTIAWIASQPWCDGNVGMVGISWGGFNSLMLAALNPPALKAIITQCSTDDRYRDDIHFMGGCLLNDNLDWASFFWAYAQGRAPDKALVGDDWKKLWLKRFENMPFLAKPWLTEQLRNDYWKHASVCEDYSNIKIPVYAMSGWADNYRNTVFSLLANLDGPRKGLVGPWAHKYPNIAYPNPKMDYVKESVRWWDRWLKDIKNGIDEEPQLTYYLQDSVRPQTDYDHRPGQWISEPTWPSPRTHTLSFYLDDGRLVQTLNPAAPKQSICSPQSTGLNGGRLCVGIRQDMEQPADQRVDDAGSLTFDTAPLAEPLAITGQVLAKLRIMVDKPTAQLAIRVCDVHPDGASTRISVGTWNLNHQDNHSRFERLDNDRAYDVTVPINNVAYLVPAGHRLRISISTAYWPLIWPSADRPTVTLDPAGCEVTVPSRSEWTSEITPPSYDKPVSYAGQSLRPYDSQRVVHHDYKSGKVCLETTDDFGRQHFDSCDTEIDLRMKQLQTIHPENPLSAESELFYELDMGREGWWTGLTAHYHMRCDYNFFYITAHWQALEDDQVVFEKQFEETIKRTGV